MKYYFGKKIKKNLVILSETQLRKLTDNEIDLYFSKLIKEFTQDYLDGIDFCDNQLRLYFKINIKKGRIRKATQIEMNPGASQ